MCGDITRLEQALVMLKSAVMFSRSKLDVHIFADNHLQMEFRNKVSQTKIRKRYNQVPHLDQITTWESQTKTTQCTINGKKAAHARPSLHLSKCQIVGNHVSRLKYLHSSTVQYHTVILMEGRILCFGSHRKTR